MDRPPVGTPVDSPIYAQPLSHPISGTILVSEEASIGFQPQLLESPEATWVLPDEAPDIMEQRSPTTVPCPVLDTQNPWAQ